MISSTSTSKLTLSGLHGRRYSLSTSWSDQSLRFKHLAYIWEAVVGAGNWRLAARVARRRRVPLSCSSRWFVVRCVLLAVYLHLFYVLALCGLLIVVAQMGRVSAMDHRRVFGTHRRLVTVNVSPAIGRVCAGVGRRVAHCVRCAGVAATALLPVLWIGGVV